MQETSPPTQEAAVNDTPDALVSDLVEWLAKTPRSRAEVFEAWRTSCPRLSIIEDALEAGWIERTREGSFVPTAQGRALVATPAV